MVGAPLFALPRLGALALAALLFQACGACEEKDPWQGARLLSPHAPGEGEVSLILGGDIMLARGVHGIVSKKAGGDFAFPFEKVAPFLQEADIAFANLESPVSSRGEKIKKKYVFRAPVAAVKGLVHAGLDVLSLANNHMLDFGPDAAEETARLLTEAGIRSGGLVRDQEPQVPVIVEVRGTKVGFLFYCDPGERYACAKEYGAFPVRPAEATREALARDIEALKPLADVIIVSMHWGKEHEPEPNAKMKTLGRFVIDAGAHIVAGHHAHIQQPAERYKDGLILYSMGNLVFDQVSWPHARVARIYRVVVSKDAVRQVIFRPFEIRHGWVQPVPLTRGFLPLEADSELFRLKLPPDGSSDRSSAR